MTINSGMETFKGVHLSPESCAPPDFTIGAIMERKPLEIRFWDKVNRRGQDECWYWKGAKNKKGYGLIGAGGDHGKLLKASRVSWIINNGPIPEGMFICHHCDIPSCVNPKHLFIGTAQTNLDDASMKNRMAHKLKEGDVFDIRKLLSDGAPQQEIASKYGVSNATICKIKYRTTWKNKAI
jgi:hypothetical protein